MFPLRTLHLFPSVDGCPWEVCFFSSGKTEGDGSGGEGSGGGETGGMGGWVNCSWNEIYEITNLCTLLIYVHYISVSVCTCTCAYEWEKNKV